MKNLFFPLSLRALELKNRVVVSPMQQYSSQDGFATDWHLVHYGGRAVGGAGLIITESAIVHPQGASTKNDLGFGKTNTLKDCVALPILSDQTVQKAASSWLI